MSNQTEWRWADPTGQQRLVREDELRAALKAGVIPPNAPVWTRGWNGWKPAHDVAELTGTPPPPPTNGDVPPPPNFVVAAKDAFEGKPAPVPTGPAEPPPPPRYVPVAANTQPHIPPALGSDTRVDAPKPAPKTSKPPPLPPGARSTPPKKSMPPPLPPGAKKTAPTPAPPKAAAAPTKTAPTPSPAAVTKTARSPLTTTKPLPKSQQQQSVFTKTQRPPAGVAPPAEELPASGPQSGRSTLQIAPAPPPMPKVEPAPKPAPKEPPPKEPSSKFPTLVMFDGEPSAPPPAAPPAETAEEAPPIVVPPPEPSNVTNAVTRPPPWGEGAVEMDTRIPKSPKLPGVSPEPETRPSEAPRPMELSSSDLSSEAKIAVVKAAPLAPAERPHATMLGIGPDALGENRVAIERALTSSAPTAPLSQSDVASTTKWEAQKPEKEPDEAPFPSPSGAKLHDLRELATERVRGVASRARRAYDDLQERTKDKPRWFLPVIAGGSACVLLILFAAGIKAIAGSSGSSAAASSSASSSSSAPPSDSTSGPLVPMIPVGPARPLACKTVGEPRTVAPKALVGSGVEVVDLGGKIALGFAVGPKEATVEIVDPSTTSSLSALHLPQNGRVRRVLALDETKAAVDVDRKDDPLEGRRTLRAATPIDLGAMDGGIAWAPMGSEKGTKLWSLQNPEDPVEALRGEPMPNNGGFAVAFRHSGAIWFGAFGGNPPAPLGGLIHVDGLGPKIGSPAVAASGDRMMAAWADRASKDDPWSVRYAFFKPTDTTVHAKTFSLAGGEPTRAMSPSIAPLGGGRFLFVWTECPDASCSVRGVVFQADGSTSSAFTASADGVNAGQGQAAVLADGRGVVAFLASVGKHVYEVHAVPIHCGEK